MSYHPNPIDVSAIELSPELTALTERLAPNANDRLAAARLEQGWTLGNARDVARKLHPCLIPYGQLPESEKGLDRTTVLGTLKAILALGYRILPPESPR